MVYKLLFRFMVMGRLWRTRCLRWAMVPIIISLSLTLRWRFFQRVFGLGLERLDADHFAVDMPGDGRLLLPCSRVFRGDEAMREPLLRLWLPVYCLDQYDARRHLSPGMTVIDGGAHVGCFSRLASRLVGPTGRVISVEPLPQNIAMLRENTRLEGGAETTILGHALAAEKGQIDLLVATTNMGYQAVTVHGEAPIVGHVTAASCTVDDIVRQCDLSRLDLIKLDVEGREADVIAGSAQALRDLRPLVVVAAYHRPEDSRRLVAQLVDLTEGYVVFTHRAYAWSEPHVVAVPQERLPDGYHILP